MTTDHVPGDPELTTPITANAILRCPVCGYQTAIAAQFRTRLLRDADGDSLLVLRTRAAKAHHVCGEPTLGLDAPTSEGPRER